MTANRGSASGDKIDPQDRDAIAYADWSEDFGYWGGAPSEIDPGAYRAQTPEQTARINKHMLELVREAFDGWPPDASAETL